jgi:hypothetical protein
MAGRVIAGPVSGSAPPSNNSFTGWRSFGASAGCRRDACSAARFDSHYRDPGHGFIVLVAHNAGGVRIKGRLAVYQIKILMVAAAQVDHGKPPAVRRRLHGLRLPVIEIARQSDGLRARRGAVKAHGFAKGLRQRAVFGEVRWCGVHKLYFLREGFPPFVMGLHLVLVVPFGKVRHRILRCRNVSFPALCVIVLTFSQATISFGWKTGGWAERPPLPEFSVH